MSWFRFNIKQKKIKIKKLTELQDKLIVEWSFRIQSFFPCFLSDVLYVYFLNYFFVMDWFINGFERRRDANWNL